MAQLYQITIFIVEVNQLNCRSKISFQVPLKKEIYSSKIETIL